jgi:hypothetical protein
MVINSFLKNKGAVAGVAITFAMIVVGLVICILRRLHVKQLNHKPRETLEDSTNPLASVMRNDNEGLEAVVGSSITEYMCHYMFPTDEGVRIHNDDTRSQHSDFSSHGTLGQAAVSSEGSRNSALSLYPTSTLPAYAETQRSTLLPAYSDLSRTRSRETQDTKSTLQGGRNVPGRVVDNRREKT